MTEDTAERQREEEWAKERADSDWRTPEERARDEGEADALRERLLRVSARGAVRRAPRAQGEPYKRRAVLPRDAPAVGGAPPPGRRGGARGRSLA